MNAPYRPYQAAAHRGALECFSRGAPSCLVELPTGAGKTRLAAGVIGERMQGGKRALFVAHRLKLVKQGAREIGKFLGRQVGVWSGEEQMFLHAPILSASKDTLHPKNLSQLDPSQFGTLVIDEAHHASSANESYGRIIDWAREGGVKTLGITATPDRSDGVTLIGDGKPFAELAYRYPIWCPEGGPSAISDGWLVPVRQEHLHVDGLDFSELKKKRNWTDQDIENVLSRDKKTMYEMASGAAQSAGDRPTVVFCPTVAFAYKMAELIDRYYGRPACVVIHGQHKEFPLNSTDRHKREKMYESGERQFAVSVDALTEGWDAPLTSHVVIMRPVKSRLRFAQQVGRGTRIVLPYSNDELLAMTPVERRAAIGASAKPDCLVTGFYSNLADLKLWVNAEDIIGAGMEPKVRERARKLNGGDTTDRLLRAKEQVDAEAAFQAWENEQRQSLEVERMKAFTPRALIRRTTVDVYGEHRPMYDDGSQELEQFRFKQSRQVSRENRPSVKAAKLAVALGLSPEHCIGMSWRQVGKFIGDAKDRGDAPDWSRVKQIKYGLSWFFNDVARDRHDMETAQ